jgi:hypothetical protein
MLQRFVQVLQGDDSDVDSDVLRRFWTRARPLPVRFEPSRGTHARVVDLAEWASRRVDR